ncbi:MAG: hypothetical protein R2882_00020, partial [Gemmatimonadales bacterium]
ASELDCLEPDEQLDRCKDLAIAASKDWFDHLTLHDQNHLVSIGLGDQGSVFMWDPAVVKDHFTSYHVYPNPGGPWDDPGPGGVAGPGGIIPFTAPPPVSGGDYVANDIYFGSLNACGTPCPYVGEYDGANCLVATGPVGSSGFIDEGEFNYQHFTSGPPCTAGTNTGVACNLASYDPGRDTPFLLNQPLYYVVADPTATLPQDRCPPGTTYDGANCLVHTGPPGAQPFLWTEPSTGSTGYYYNWLPGPQHCQPPAVDDTAHCDLGPVPTGWDPFSMTRPLYYVTAVACGTKKPVYMGETGFTVYPYPTGAADFWDPPPSGNLPAGLTGAKQTCDRVEGGPEIDFVKVGGQ